MVCEVFYCFVAFQGVCDYGSVYSCEIAVYVLFCNGVWISTSVCCVSNVVGCGVFLESVSVLLVCVVSVMGVVLLSDL